MAHRSFPSIEQFRHCVADVLHRARYAGCDSQGEPVYDLARPLPKLVFEGTVKLHGTNAGIRCELSPGGWLRTPQCRTRDISPKEDNAGFAAWLDSGGAARGGVLDALVEAAVGAERQGLSSVTLFGEWVGNGVNGKTGIGGLDNRLVLFALVTDFEREGEVVSEWHEVEKVATATGLPRATFADQGVFFIRDFQTWRVEVDFSDPAQALEELERLTLEVEADCPVARAMGGAGLGEGLVWAHRSPQYGRLCFKTKGLKHKGTKSSRLVDIAPEVLASRQAFVEAVLTESRLEQGLAYLVEQGLAPSLDHIGRYLQWVGQDVLKEEMDTLMASGLEKRDVMKAVNNAAKAWFVESVGALAV